MTSLPRMRRCCLDRLVRQGRAFGVHVMLGSQTLSGAYSLARSTMGQMAVRVALQCSEADAHVILSDERNMAARYLTRPGEAIYNDQNGLLAGNQPFQVVWLSEPKRIEYLRTSGRRSPRNRASSPRPRSCSKATRRPTLPRTSSSPTLWPTGPRPRPRRGRRPGSARRWPSRSRRSFTSHRTPAAICWSSAAKKSRRSACWPTRWSPWPLKATPRFFVLDGTRPASPLAGAWQQLADALADSITVGGPRNTASMIAEVAAEIARREAAGEEDAPPWYLVIHDAGRFRDLRRNEDDFSFSMDRDKPPRPDKQWAEIVRNGPAWGVHSLVWCDSYNDVNRLVDRQTLREFELRVLFQMSAADSTNLLDTPAASRLRQHRGLFYSDDLGTQEKFRPYGPPTKEWLAQIQRMLSAPRNDRGLCCRKWQRNIRGTLSGANSHPPPRSMARAVGQRAFVGDVSSSYFPPRSTESLD